MDRLKGLFWGLVVCTVMTLLSGCTTTKFVPVPSVDFDSVFVDRWLRDSVYQHDSVFVNLHSKGDTVFVDKVVTKYEYKDRLRYDTVSVVRVDSVQVPYPVEKDLGWWDKTRMCSFPVLLALVAVLSLVVFAIKRKQP